MDYSLILKAFLAQMVVIAIIVFVLKKILDRQLIESAIEKLKILHIDPLDKNMNCVEVVTYDPLSEENKKKISDAIYQKVHRHIPLTVSQDKSIKGGIVIKIPNRMIDHSLISRLKESGMIK